MTVNLLTIKHIRSFLASELEKIYDPDELEPLTRIIIDTVTGQVAPYLRYDPERELRKEDADRIIVMVARLKEGEPYQYVLGETEFCGCRILVNKSVLIPRPETELMADIIIKENKGFTGKITDFGTGSGCIAIALAKHFRGSQVTAIDNSAAALELASENARINGVSISILNMDILQQPFPLHGKARIIVSNPPYVRKSEIKHMRRNVIDFEPHEALFVDDRDPLLYYRAITGIAQNCLETGGIIYFEINEALGTEIEELLRTRNFSDVKIIRDLYEKNRIIKGLKNG